MYTLLCLNNKTVAAYFLKMNLNGYENLSVNKCKICTYVEVINKTFFTA